MNFPVPDPIPLPAPVWLMKFLSLLTLALHFSAVMILVGSLGLLIYHNVKGRRSKDRAQLTASAVLARRLTVMMTFVINLGVPPLLFLQVLYGQAIYTSSVLMAVLWISVIFQLMLAYWLLYRTQAWIAANRPAWIPALISLLVVLGIGQIYSFNMTLMLRPEVWHEMYSNSASGLNRVGGDPTTTPRWLFVMAGGLVFGGAWSLLHSNMKHLDEATKKALARSGGLTAAVGAILQLVMAMRVMQSQPDGITSGIQANPLFNISGYLFVAGTLVAALLCGMMGLRAAAGFWTSVLACTFAFLANVGAVLVRDGIRDLTLAPKGFDVFNRTEASNWSVIAVFLLLFVIMLGVLYWLLSVMHKATPPKEQVSL